MKMALGLRKMWHYRWVRLMAFGFAFWLALFATFATAAILDRLNTGGEFDIWRILFGWGIAFSHWVFLAPPIHYWTTTDRFVDATILGKIWQSIFLLIASALAVLLYMYLVAAPALGQPFIPFVKSFQLVQWIWDIVLFVIVVLFGYQSVVLKRSREARLKAATLGQQLAEQQRDLSAREAEYLRGRLGSHFVMNALSNLVGLMRLGQVRRAEEATILLSDILRSMTGASGADECIPLEAEIEDAKKYLAFQQIRFPELTATYEIEHAASNLAVPRQILQPLLENVFKHGPRGAVQIRVYAQEIEGDLILTVSNTMPGDNADTENDGEGMLLTKLRLEMAFDSTASVSRRLMDGLYQVELRFPAKNGDSRDD